MGDLMKKLSKLFLSLTLVLTALFPILVISGCTNEGDGSSAQKTSISSISGIKTTYLEDEPFSKEDSASVEITFNNGEKQTVTQADLTISNFSSEKVGRYKMSIGYANFKYQLPYSVEYQNIYFTNQNSLPSSFFYKQTINFSNYSIKAKAYNSYKTILLSDDKVEITNLDVETISTSIKTAVITCGGKSIRLEYDVWWTEYNKTYDLSFSKSCGEFQLNGFKINTNGTMSGNMSFMATGSSQKEYIYFSNWEETSRKYSPLDIRTKNGNVVLKYGEGGFYLMSNSFSSIDSEMYFSLI